MDTLILQTVPTISVIIPARNAAGTIGRTLESLAPDRQLILEILLVDDGSTDGTGAAGRAAAARLDLPLTQLACSAGSAGAARNIGLSAARGTLIYFLDADDEVISGGLPRLARLLLSGRAADIAIGTAIRRAAGRADKPKIPNGYTNDPAENAQNYFRNELWPIAMGSALVCREAACAARFPETVGIDEDTCYWTAILMRASVATVQEPVLHYNLDENRISQRLVDSPRRQFINIAAAFDRLGETGLEQSAIRWRKSWVAMRMARQLLITGNYEMARRLLRPALANPDFRSGVRLRVARYQFRIRAGLVLGRIRALAIRNSPEINSPA